MNNPQQAICNLIYRYAELIDNGDLEGVAELFRNGEIAAPAEDSVVRGYDEVLAMYRAACRIYPDCGTPKTQHITTNVAVEVDGDSASARSRFTVFQALDDFPLQAIISGRYHDTFHLADGQWCFSRREMHVVLMGDCSRHLLYSP
ncbi:MAG: nuclear transport factor 2 family protein [Halieaceae bacterium]|nr:nuclear transport factor 2 family protein [Halieaceae bacterium]